MYAVMLLLGLSILCVSCSTSPESQAKQDAKAIYKAHDRGDLKAEDKAWDNYAIHLQMYEDQGKGRVFEDAFDEAIKKELDR